MPAQNTEGRLRRDFLKHAAALGGATLWGGGLSQALAQTSRASVWKNQIGLELYTVRDLMMSDFEGVLAKIAQMGYREVEPASGYNNMDPKTFRAMLDRYGLRMPSTHSGARGTGADLEKQLEGFQIMGIEYTEILGDSANSRRMASEIFGSDVGAADANALRHRHEVRRRVKTRPDSPGPTDRIEHRSRRTFAVRAGDLNPFVFAFGIIEGLEQEFGVSQAQLDG